MTIQQTDFYQTKFAKRAIGLEPSPLAEMLNLVSGRPDIISFAAGTPDTNLLPIELLEQLTRQAVEKYGKSILQYGHTLGFAPLRQTFADQLLDVKINCTPEDIVISTGASGAINAICMALLDSDDSVFVEDPTYTLALEAFSVFGANIVPIRSDDDGMLPDELEKQLQTQKAKFIYILPNFQNPTGRTISTGRRQTIAGLAQKYDTLVLEDDIYVDLRYFGQHLPSIHSFAPQHTMYVSSVSKLFAPAMRLGVSVLPPAILQKIAYLKPSLDFQASTFTQALTNEFLRSKHLKTHLEQIKKTYDPKRRALLSALDKHMPAGFTWTQPAGGMFVWVSGPNNFDADRFLPEAIQSGVAYLPGSAFMAEPSRGRKNLRLCFAAAPLSDIEPGVKILADAIRKWAI
jgi:2-aminoadipate transaminase